MTQAVLVLFPVLMIAAALSDLIAMRIPNWLALAVAALFVPMAAMAGMPLADAGLHLLAALAVLAVAFALFALGWMGGGDAKLAAATALWFGFPLLLPYLIYAALLGGGVTLLVIIWRRIPMPAAATGIGWVGRLYDRKAGIPYGIALAVAGVMVYLQSPLYLQLAG